MQTLHGSGKFNTQSWSPDLGGVQSALGLLTPLEIKQLREAVAKRHIPEDLTSKFLTLSEGDFGMCHIAHTGNIFLELLHSACQGEFTEITPSDFEQILRVLAYVRKDDDAIPDFLPSGFVDDAKEMRIAETQLAEVIRRYKTWRLRRKVPTMWTRDNTALLCVTGL